MKSTLRRIQIDSRTFLWKVSRFTPSTVRLRVWAEGQSSRPWADVICRSDDVWLNLNDRAEAGASGVAVGLETEPVRPKLVAEVIRMAMPLVESGGVDVRPGVFVLSADGLLVSQASGGV
jgi:hypothetical protein